VLVEPIGWRGILGVVAAFTGLPVVMVGLWGPPAPSGPPPARREVPLRLAIT